MAIIDNKGRIRGIAGSVVFRTYRNKNIVQGKPRKFKQSGASIRAATEFGLSSSAAAVIRRTFEPAYFHRDGAAASRTTKQVYRSLRNSPSCEAGRRDLHNANLQDLVGMEFNGSSKLSEVLQMNYSVAMEKDHLELRLGTFQPRQDVRKAAGYPKRASLYRIRLMTVAFNFRRECLMYLDMLDLDATSSQTLAEQTIRLKAQAEPGWIVMLSMSLLIYDEKDHTGEYLLLNNKGFSPCAIIAAYQSADPGEPNPEGAEMADLSDDAEGGLLMEMCRYRGNRLLRKLSKCMNLDIQQEKQRNVAIKERALPEFGKIQSFRT